jgi:hypothetical protein
LRANELDISTFGSNENVSTPPGNRDGRSGSHANDRLFRRMLGS